VPYLDPFVAGFVSHVLAVAPAVWPGSVEPCVVGSSDAAGTLQMTVYADEG